MQIGPKELDNLSYNKGIYVVLETETDLANGINNNTQIVCACWSYELAKGQLLTHDSNKIRTIQGPIKIIDGNNPPKDGPFKPTIPRGNPFNPINPNIDPFKPSKPNIDPFNPHNPFNPNNPFQ